MVLAWYSPFYQVLDSSLIDHLLPAVHVIHMVIREHPVRPKDDLWRIRTDLGTHPAGINLLPSQLGTDPAWGERDKLYKIFVTRQSMAMYVLAVTQQNCSGDNCSSNNISQNKNQSVYNHWVFVQNRAKIRVN